MNLGRGLLEINWWMQETPLDKGHNEMGLFLILSFSEALYFWTSHDAFLNLSTFLHVYIEVYIFFSGFLVL